MLLESNQSCSAIPQDKMQAVYKATRVLQAEAQPGAAGNPAHSVAEQFARVLDAAACRVFLFDKNRNGKYVKQGMYPEPAGSTPAPMVSLPLSLHAEMAGGMFTEQPVLSLMSGHETSKDLWNRFVQAGLLSEGCRSAMLVAFQDGGTLLGLVLAEFSDEECLSPNPIRQFLAQQLSCVGSLVLYNADRVRQLDAQCAALSEHLNQKNAELSLANAELMRAMRLSDQFMANMSHELRTPLNTILGMSQALQEGVMGPITDDQMNYLQMVEKAGRHLLTMLTDILTLSKMGAGRLELILEPVAAQACVMDCMHFVIQPARQKRIKMDVKTDPQMTIFLADENLVKQILVNLLSNAVKFTPEGGTIKVEMTCNAERETVDFCVSDTGIGIAKENMHKLFRPFVQLDETLSRLYPGTGLGLCLVYKSAEIHGGSVSVASELGKGSRFSVSLPWRKAPTLEESATLPSTGEAEAASAEGETEHFDIGPKVLLVEKNEVTIKTLVHLLHEQGYSVAVAREGTEALNRIYEENPAYILLDMQLVDMDGEEITRHIRSNSLIADIPVILMTSISLPGGREQALEAGANEYLVKPIVAADLKGALDKCTLKTTTATVAGLTTPNASLQP